MRSKNLLLMLLHASGLLQYSSLHQLDRQIEPLCLAISPDNAFVALGLGIRILMLHFDGFQVQWSSIFPVPEFNDPLGVRFQACSFSSDSSYLVVSTQRLDRQRSQSDDVVYTYVWRCQQEYGPPIRLWACRIPTVSHTWDSQHGEPILSLCSRTAKV